MGDFLSIGELGAMFGLNVQTLYYYDSIGLFKPRVRERENGRRKYEFQQVYELATICYLRRLGCSLDEIREFKQTQHADISLQYLNQRSEELHRQWSELLNIDEAIQRKISFTRQEMDGIQTEDVFVRHYETRRYIPIGDEKALYRDNSFYFYPTVVFYGEREKYFGAYLFPDSSDSVDGIGSDNVIEIEAGDFLCGYHLGEYENVQETIDLIKGRRPDLMLEETAILLNILDQFVENDSSNYITMIQVRIM